MAHYLIEYPYFDGKKLHAGPVIEVPDDTVPSVTWRDPMTGELVKPSKPVELVLTAEEKATVLRAREIRAAQEAARREPVKPVQPAQQKGRASDKETI